MCEIKKTKKKSSLRTHDFDLNFHVCQANLVKRLLFVFLVDVYDVRLAPATSMTQTTCVPKVYHFFFSPGVCVFFHPDV